MAFYSDRSGYAALWIWERSTGQLRQVGQVASKLYRPERGILRWMSDSRRVLVKIFPDSKHGADPSKQTLVEPQNVLSESPRDVRLEIYESTADPLHVKQSLPLNSDAMAPDQLAQLAADIALIDINNGEIRRLTSGFVPVDFWLSPTGDSIAFLNAKGFKRVSDFDYAIYDIVVVSLTNNTTHVVASDILEATKGDAVTWSPDGRLLSYLSASDWFIVPAEGGPSRKATKGNDSAFSFWEQSPLWAPDGQWLYATSGDTVWKISATNGAAAIVGRVVGLRIQRIVTHSDGQFWSTDGGRSLVVVAKDEETKSTGFYTIDVLSGNVAPVNQPRDVSRPLLVETTKTSNEIYYVGEDADHSPNIWAMHVDKNPNGRRITNINSVFDGYVMGRSRLIEWRGGDGQRLRGALLLPAGYQQKIRYPLIVYVYGGLMLSDRHHAFGYTSLLNSVENMQVWATRGYAVLLPDTPLRIGTPMLDIAKTVLPGVDKLIEMSVVDPDRIGVMGSSYGGYSTLALITQTTRFKAAISDAGLANLLSVYGWMPDGLQGPSWQGWAESGSGRMGGTPWSYRERYIENSPMFYLDRVQTPLLIIQGTEDRGAKDYYSNELFMNLRRLGKEVTYLKYKGADHTISSFNYEQQVDVLNRMIAWFDRWLKSENPGPSASK
ncbi:MAG TPA: prolyl oligopeptidase family serine peptidase [Pyrinomonadaceae bacterium]|nr:prolyl oligopeptidase family serine peptidase [Pyrinomonadaceae bacterium]